jgi:2-polyprenyl-6-methoxyphenol hydroxylase-like FAD-dependent oxidoreductase
LTTTGGVGGGRLAWLSSRDDGGRSLIRKAAGIAFPGWDPTVSHLIAEVELAEEPAWGLRRDALGIHSLSSMGEGGPVRRCDIL